MADDYIKTDTAVITLPNGKKRELLWGDLCRNVTINGTVASVTARGMTGTVDASALGGKPLLEFYFIDVGQGDGVLVKTPDGKHILIDAGFKRLMQPTGKNAADFVDWKFSRDYGLNEIKLDAMIASHNDADHYGGLWDLINPAADARLEIKADKVSVENFYHAGVAWRKSPEKKRWLGKRKSVGGKSYLTQLMGDRADVVAALDPSATERLQGDWESFMDCVAKTTDSGGAPTPIARLSNLSGELPGFAINDPATGRVSVRVLAPVEYSVSGAPALRFFKSGDSQTTNGNSILLRFDFGRARILVTGDLNQEAQNALMEKYQGNFEEFACDVSKACHHGSDDVSFKFLSLMKPAVTAISSGDAEGHDHPRPSIVGASAVTGYFEVDHNTDRLVSPLIYSTELARSLGLGRPESISFGNPTQKITGQTLDRAVADCAQTSAGALKPTRKQVNLNDSSRIVTDLIYGLVNVRTDGDRILCATLNEDKYTWQTKLIRSRFV